MFYVSEIQTSAPGSFSTPLQEKTYSALSQLHIPFERVDTDEAVSMQDCVLIDQKLNMKMVKTLFLCDRRQTAFYLFITTGDKPFSSKNFSTALGISRVSFAPADKMLSMLGTKIGAATVFSALADTGRQVRIVFDKQAADQQWYGCSDGTTTGYLKIHTSDILGVLLPYTGHRPEMIEV